MELLQELFVTAVVAVLFSFLIAKLVAVAMPGESGRDSGKNVDRETNEELRMEELLFPERLEVERLENETRTELVQNVSTETVEEFVAQQQSLEEVVESVNQGEITETSHEQSVRESVEEVLNEEEEEKSAEEIKVEKSDHAVEDEKLTVDSEPKVKSVVEIDVVDEDDGWEGIERSELEKEFAEAAKFVESGEKSESRLGSGGSDVQMELYGLHKVATEGPCREQPPMALKLSARAKWNAWQRLGNMNPEVAMERYIALVSDQVPGWMEEKPAGGSEAGPSEEANDSAIAPDSSTFSSDLPNNSNKGDLEVEAGPKGIDLTGGSVLENRAKE